jgi:hypothetical protein
MNEIKRAFQLTVMKWNWIVNNNGIADISSMINKVPTLNTLQSKNGLCDLYWLNSDNPCKGCPLLLDKDDITTNCSNSHHPYSIWFTDRSKDNAKQMLKFVKDKSIE